ncbi:hypothetical protein ALP8811_01291 [Aliiroseovarius pelagivivens]|uniref:Uncharacterized protein n=1 Tax=Aliiroseovarius pelagivivens TaxID=1639690 RepID=A0A2R8AK66_9RHOB|nr:DUF6477 family protein [Aliiroseovarius pelagivivens]SPF76289.1 hypothetical protein ALP8811_01291 [Aliiroseovarius pelagivivens]
MTTTIDMLKTLRRPRLLVRAARFGLSEYNRDKDLRKLMKTSSTPSPTQAVDGLLVAEAQLEHTRKSGDASYSCAQHVEVLIALLAELQLLPRSNQQA